MSVAFEDVCRALDVPQTAAEARQIIAARIVDLARRGLMDADTLRGRVLSEARTPQT